MADWTMGLGTKKKYEPVSDKGYGKAKMSKDQFEAFQVALSAYDKGDWLAAAKNMEATGSKEKFSVYDKAMKMLSSAAEKGDEFGSLQRSMMLGELQQERKRRQMNFFVGPRGIEGPMSNMIFGGGTSRPGA